MMEIDTRRLRNALSRASIFYHISKDKRIIPAMYIQYAQTRCIVSSVIQFSTTNSHAKA